MDHIQWIFSGVGVAVISWLLNIKLRNNYESKVANVYWSGSDLMKTLCSVQHKKSAHEIKHNMTQFIHQISSSGLAPQLTSLSTLTPYTERLSKHGESFLTDELYEELFTVVSRVHHELAGYINSLQKDYKPYPEHNEQTWKDMKSKKQTLS